MEAAATTVMRRPNRLGDGGVRLCYVDDVAARCRARGASGDGWAWSETEGGQKGPVDFAQEGTAGFNNSSLGSCGRQHEDPTVMVALSRSGS